MIDRPTDDAPTAAKILIADDEAPIRQYMGELLRERGYEVLEAADGEEALVTTLRSEPELVLLDMQMPNRSGLSLLEEAKDRGSASDFIVVTGFSSVELAVKAMRAGARDIVRKPVMPDALVATVDSFFRASALPRASAGGESSGVNIVGESPLLLAVTQTIRRAAPTRATVLVLGESGTGKELIAQLLHEASDRAARPFIRVNCAALPPTLLESELFGHERGAFTGAAARREGRFELANGGTLFLDEIGELSQEIQVKLLRFLQTREFERVGSSRTMKSDVRVVAATNRPLLQLVREGQFREDLYYRLNVVSVQVPSLRERKGDIPKLAEHFLKYFASEYGKPLRRITSRALDALMAHPWPGNVRELQNAIERATVLSNGEELTADLVSELMPTVLTTSTSAIAHAALAGRPLADIEREAILSTLAMVGGSPSRAAAMLGISVRKIYYRLREYRVAHTEG